ncbi:hypothetical protein SAMN04488523_1217 [Sulfitobacter brevis]|uniref:HdeA/HdeB family protein n=1 Tax=Sulfitobacter brevis TaxID=74348 RepID=A0A1I2G9V1_9RHOB|nr:hypothetical protein [Sulfitobacter brevis]SFF14365.1 hypothetical protein SAMN04488523_1217 [Sulfitobacter brevis]
MRLLYKTIAVAGLTSIVSAPVFAAAHMSCADFKALTPDVQAEVASLAIAEFELGSTSGGEPKAVEATGGNEADANMWIKLADDETLEAFKAVCDQNLDAMLSEAAARINTIK